MTNVLLTSLIEKFTSGHSIPPVVLSNDDVISVINTLKKTHFLDLYEIRKEYIEGVFFFENESEIIKIDRARDIIAQASKRSNSLYDIFIIEGIDTVTLAAANSLLKLFEEVPSNILILLTSYSQRDSMIETLASRVMFISTNIYKTSLDPEIRTKIDIYFDAGDIAPIISYIAQEKLEKSVYMSILLELQKRICSGHIKKLEIIEKIEKGIITLSSSNANPRWFIDDVILSL